MGVTVAMNYSPTLRKAALNSPASPQCSEFLWSSDTPADTNEEFLDYPSAMEHVSLL